MNSEEAMIAAGGHKPEAEQSAERDLRELEARFHRLSQQTAMKPTTDSTKALRVSIDACIKEARALAGSINRGPGGRELSLAITRLQEAKMWAGQVLGELGHKLPEEYRDEAKEV